MLESVGHPSGRITVWRVDSPDKDKFDVLCQLVLSLEGGKTIVFANYRESVERIHHYLVKKHINAAVYHGAMEQREREQAVAMLNNGSVNVLVATDLASRGLDIDTVEHIIHYHLPVSEQAYVHRNGRTARVDAVGNAYVIAAPGEPLPVWAIIEHSFELHPAASMPAPAMATLYFQAGKKDKISRGDIMGFVARNGGIDADAVGRIDVRDHYAMAAVPRELAQDILQRLQKLKIKGKKVRISMLK